MSGKHRGDRHDSNPLHGIIRNFEPAHSGLGPDDASERDPDAVETFDPITSTAETEVISYGRSPAYPEFEADPAPYPAEPVEADLPPDVNQADYEYRSIRRAPVWLPVLVLTIAVVVVLVLYGLSRTGGAVEVVSDRYSPSQVPSLATVTVTAKASTAKRTSAKPEPVVTEWKTKTATVTPAPMISYRMVPGPKVTVTRTATAKPKPAPTVTRTCLVVITVNRAGSEIDREESGACP